MRILTINVKGALPISPSDDQLAFQHDSMADSLPTESTSPHNFKITQLEPATPGQSIIPADSDTWHESALFAWVQSAAGQAVIEFPGPRRLRTIQRPSGLRLV